MLLESSNSLQKKPHLFKESDVLSDIPVTGKHISEVIEDVIPAAADKTSD